MLTQQWSDDHAAFQDRVLSDRDFDYVWAGAVQPKVQLSQAHSSVLVLLGVRLDGTKELIVLAEGLGLVRSFDDLHAMTLAAVSTVPDTGPGQRRPDIDHRKIRKPPPCGRIQRERFCSPEHRSA